MPATREDSPLAVKVQLASPANLKNLDRYVMNEDYWMERKFDGFRLIVVMHEFKIYGLSRAGRDQDIENRLPRLHDELRAFAYDHGWWTKGHTTIFDGELVPRVAPAFAGPQDFRRVTEIMKSDPARANMLQAMDGDLCYVVFDLIKWQGEDLVERGEYWPLSKRRGVLTKHCFNRMRDDEDLPLISLSNVYPVDPAMIQEWMTAGGEGAIIKDSTKPYSPGRSTRNGWHKVKDRFDSDVVCMGFTEARFGKDGKFFLPDGTPMIGAIKYGQYRECICGGSGPGAGVQCLECGNRGTVLEYRGQCSGMLDSMREELTQNGQDYIGQVFMVKHMGIQKANGGFRHPQFGGWRDDKLPHECEWE